jgi:hypothetical protein
MKTRLYVGCKAGSPRIVFRAAQTPTFESHGHLFNATIGPFYTKAGAQFMAQYGQGNPHCRCVSEAERLARKFTAEGKRSVTL